MNVSQAIAKLLAIPEDRIPILLRDGPDDHKLCLDGAILGLKMPMPNCQDALLRVGRHLWKVTWLYEHNKTHPDAGGLHEASAEQLTQANT